MEIDIILEIINQGENSTIEFKNSSVKKESLAKEIVSFSNSHGGTILIGVEDDGTISGITNNLTTHEEWVMNIARDALIPATIVEYEQIEISNKIIAIITIPKGLNKPYQTKDNKYLVRVGSTNRVATQSELMRLFQQSGFFHYDLIAVDKSSDKNLDNNELEKYFSKYKMSFLDESVEDRMLLLKNSDILTKNGECTVAGLLLFGFAPQKFLHNASISLVRFRGNDINQELLDKQIVDGSIIRQIDTVTAIIKNHIPIISSIEGNKRVDSGGHYSEKVIRELIVNAVVHRNYSIIGSSIRIFIFDNRIEFISPGRLPNTITIDKIIVGVSYAINPILVKFMENLRYIDKLGRGIPMVYNEAKALNKKIDFQEIGEEFKVTLYL